MKFNIVSIFPEIIWSTVKQGVVGRALDRSIIQLQTWNPRDYAKDVHRTVDDRPFGGGPGMVMKPDPVLAAVRAAKESVAWKGLADGGSKCIYLTPQGRRINQKLLHESTTLASITMLCGRYEGIDERIIESEIDEEWSLGDFVLSGGEIAAAAVVDGVSRLLPGVLGDSNSAKTDSFEGGLLACPQYTRPENFEGMRVPKVLLSGDHEKIRLWRLEQSLKRTLERRPDLLRMLELNRDNETHGLLEKIIGSHSSS